MSCGFLDYVWSALLILAAAGFTSSMLSLVFARALRGFARPFKWFLNIQYLSMCLSLPIAIYASISANPDLARGCFATFADKSALFPLTRMFAALWIAIVIALLILDFVRTMAAIRDVRALPKARDPRLDETCRLMGIRRQIGLRKAALRTGPYALGVIRPEVVMPIGLDEATARGVIAHELAHIRDCDALWMLAERVARRLMFFNPLMYALYSEYLLTVERAADEQAVQRGGIRAAELGSALLSVAQSFSRRAPEPLKVRVSRSYREIRARLESLGEPRRAGAVAWSLVLVAFTFSAATSVALAGRALPEREERMCRQLEHERLIESWFRDESEVNRCEEKQK